MDPGASDICTYFKDHMSEWQRKSERYITWGSILVQYVYDLLLASKTHKNCLKYTIFPCTALAGHPGISLFKDLLERCSTQAVMLLIKSTFKTLLQSNLPFSLLVQQNPNWTQLLWLPCVISKHQVPPLLSESSLGSSVSPGEKPGCFAVGELPKRPGLCAGRKVVQVR